MSTFFYDAARNAYYLGQNLRLSSRDVRSIFEGGLQQQMRDHHFSADDIAKAMKDALPKLEDRYRNQYKRAFEGFKDAPPAASGPVGVHGEATRAGGAAAAVAGGIGASGAIGAAGGAAAAVLGGGAGMSASGGTAGGASAAASGTGAAAEAGGFLSGVASSITGSAIWDGAKSTWTKLLGGAEAAAPTVARVGGRRGAAAAAAAAAKAPGFWARAGSSIARVSSSALGVISAVSPVAKGALLVAGLAAAGYAAYSHYHQETPATQATAPRPTPSSDLGVPPPPVAVPTPVPQTTTVASNATSDAANGEPQE